MVRMREEEEGQHKMVRVEGAYGGASVRMVVRVKVRMVVRVKVRMVVRVTCVWWCVLKVRMVVRVKGTYGGAR